MAELLVKAKSHWKDGFTQAQIDALTPKQLDEFNSRSQIGDIIVVRPDGWVWGKEECLPNFVVIKIPSLSYEDAKGFEEQLQAEVDDLLSPTGKTMKVLKRRKYQIPLEIVNSLKEQSKTVEIIESQVKDNFISNIIDKEK